MKARRLILMLGMLLITAMAILTGVGPRLPWVFSAALIFLGIALFDQRDELMGSWPMTTIFLLVMGLCFKALLEHTNENFWRDFSGVGLCLAFGFELAAGKKRSTPLYSSSLFIGLLLFVSVAAAGIPDLKAPITLSCYLFSLFLLAGLHIPAALQPRHENGLYLMTAIHCGVFSLGTLFYSSTFMPSLVTAEPFLELRWILPTIGFFIALAICLSRHGLRRVILFSVLWALAVIWVALTMENHRILTALLASVIFSWSLALAKEQDSQYGSNRELLLKLSVWFIPGSVLFSLWCLMIFPSSQIYTNVGATIWLVAFLIVWVAIGLNPWKRAGKEAEEMSSWRDLVHVGLTFLGPAIFLMMPFFTDINNWFWGFSP